LSNDTLPTEARHASAPGLLADARKASDGESDLVRDAGRIVADYLARPGTACITCSFQAEDVVVLHMLREIRPDIPVLFLDTVHHFSQTYAYRDELANRWKLNVINLRAAEIKNIKSPVAGRANVLIVPDLEAGNMLAKSLSFLADADAAGIVLGARVPIILTSRADSVTTRLASCAVAALVAKARRETPARTVA
jgi:hypothetical protein